MKKYVFLLSLTLILFQQALGQKFDLGFNLGYGFYQLNDLKKYQSEKKDEYSQLNIKAVEKFPGSYNYNLFVNYFVNRRNVIGLTGTYFTTGGRNHLKDYSGEYKLDMILNGYKIGMNYQNIVFPYKRIRISLKFEVGITFNDLQIDEYMYLLNEEILNENKTYKSFAWSIEPTVDISYRLLKKVYINLDMGYERNARNVLREQGNQAEELENSDGRFGINWSGFRFSAGLFFEI